MAFRLSKHNFGSDHTHFSVVIEATIDGVSEPNQPAECLWTFNNELNATEVLDALNGAQSVSELSLSLVNLRRDLNDMEIHIKRGVNSDLYRLDESMRGIFDGIQQRLGKLELNLQHVDAVYASARSVSRDHEVRLEKLENRMAWHDTLARSISEAVSKIGPAFKKQTALADETAKRVVELERQVKELTENQLILLNAVEELSKQELIRQGRLNSDPDPTIVLSDWKTDPEIMGK